MTEQSTPENDNKLITIIDDAGIEPVKRKVSSMSAMIVVAATSGIPLSRIQESIRRAEAMKMAPPSQLPVQRATLAPKPDNYRANQRRLRQMKKLEEKRRSKVVDDQA